LFFKALFINFIFKITSNVKNTLNFFLQISALEDMKRERKPTRCGVGP